MHKYNTNIPWSLMTVLLEYIVLLDSDFTIGVYTSVFYVHTAFMPSKWKKTTKGSRNQSCSFRLEVCDYLDK